MLGLDFDTLFNVIGTLAMGASIFAQMQKSMKLFRGVMMIACLFWIGYNVMAETYIQCASYAMVLAIHTYRCWELSPDDAVSGTLATAPEAETAPIEESDPAPAAEPSAAPLAQDLEPDLTFDQICAAQARLKHTKAELEHLAALEAELDAELAAVERAKRTAAIKARVAKLNRTTRASKPASNVLMLRPVDEDVA